MSRLRALGTEAWLSVGLVLAWMGARFGSTGWGPNASDVWVQARRHADPDWLLHDAGANWDVPYRAVFEVLVAPALRLGVPASVAHDGLGWLLLIAFSVVLVTILRTCSVAAPWWLAGVVALAVAPSVGAGEWFLVAVEAKGLAWLAGLFAVAAWLHRRDGAAWGLLGGAASLHPLVGGGLALGVGVATLWQAEWGRLRWLPLALLTGAPGLLALARTPLGGDPAVFETYVQARMAHHLLPAHWAVGWPGRLAGVALAVGAAWRWRPDTRPLLRVALGATPLALLGLGLWGAGRVDLLRFFWFRVPDALLPVAAVVGLGAWVSRWPRAGWVVSVVVALLAGRPDPRAADPLHADIAAHVAAGERVFADPTDARLTLVSGRARVVSWKQVPHDAPQLAEWRARLEAASGGPLPVGGLAARARVHDGWAALPWEDRVAVARRYGADWVVAPTGGFPADLTPVAVQGDRALLRLP